MKKKVIVVLILSIFTGFLFSQSSGGEEKTYSEKFQSAFLSMINSANNKFKDIYYEDRFIEESDDRHELKIYFPEAFDNTFFRKDYTRRADEMPQTIYFVQIDYNTNKENSALAQYGIEENDEAKMKALYNKLVSELMEIRSQNIGNGNWKIIDDGPYAFTMESDTSDFPTIVVGIDIGTLLGVKLRIKMIQY